jgi:signal transduction histidine kinase
MGAKVLAPASAETNPTWAASYLVDGCHAMGIPSVPAPRAFNGWHSAVFKTQRQDSWVQIDFGEPKCISGIRLIPAHPADYPDRAGFGFPLCFKIETAARSDFLEPSLVFDSGDRHFVNPGDTPVSFVFPQRGARVVRVTASELWERNRDFVFALAEFEALSGGTNVARGAGVSSSDQTITALWKPEFLVDGNGGRGLLVDEHEWLKGLHRKRVVRGELEMLSAQRQVAERIAHTRLLFWGAFWCVVACVSALGFAFHLRRSRRNEIASLRNQISKDLHDEIGSSLCSIRLISEMSVDQMQKASNDREALSEIGALAAQSTEALREIVWMVKAGDFPSCEMLLEQMRRSVGSLLLGMEWDFVSQGAFSDKHASLDLHRDMLMFFRESLHNIARHSGATRVRIVLSIAFPGLCLSVSDNGRGFDTEGPVAGRGLQNMRERAASMAGVLEINSIRGEGTKITLEVPLA